MVAIARHIDSVLNRATVVGFFALQDMRLLPISEQYPVVDLRVVSEWAVKANDEPKLIRYPKSRIPLRYLIILFTIWKVMNRRQCQGELLSDIVMTQQASCNRKH